MESGGSKNPAVLTPLIILQSDDKKCAEPLAQDVLRSMIFTPQGDKNPNTFNNFNGNYDSSIYLLEKYVRFQQTRLVKQYIQRFQECKV